MPSPETQKKIELVKRLAKMSPQDRKEVFKRATEIRVEKARQAKPKG